MPYTRSLSVVPSPSPMASLKYACPASRRLQYGYPKRREAERGPGKEASSACCERLPEQQTGSSLLFTSVVFYKPTALLYGRQQNGQQVADKSKEMRRCQRVVDTLNKLDASSNGIHALYTQCLLSKKRHSLQVEQLVSDIYNLFHNCLTNRNKLKC